MHDAAAKVPDIADTDGESCEIRPSTAFGSIDPLPDPLSSDVSETVSHRRERSPARLRHDSPAGRPMSSHANTRLDDVDRRVIAALQTDGRRPYSRIAADLGVSESVVRYRVQRLEEAGVLQVVGIADPLRLGFDRMALVGIRVRPGMVREVCQRVVELPETSYVVMVAGSFDVLIELVCRDTAHFTEVLTERLQKIDGIVATESFFALEIHKLAYGWGVPEVSVVLESGEEDDEGAAGP
jgi:Lrp/AsnC family transcriptional regulator for asnA, asnC and gidA